MQRISSLLLLLLLSFWTLSCGSPQNEAVGEYVTAMSGLMAQNAQVASQFLTLAMSIHKEKAEPDAVAARIEKEVLPESDKLKDAIAAVKPGTPELKEVHDQAVTAWTLQAKGYHEVVDAYKSNNLEAFTEGQKKVGQAKVMAETYIREVNTLIEPMGYHLDEFPQAQ